MRIRTTALVGTVLALTLAGCGSTVEQRTVLGGNELGGSSPMVGGPTVGGQQSTGAGLAAGQSGDPFSVSHAASSGGPASGGTTAPLVGGSTPNVAVPSVTRPLRVGIILASGNPGTAFGVTTAATNNAQIENEFNAIAGDINARGGFGGHRISLVFAEDDRTDTGSNSQTPIQNQICTSLTEDNHVDFVIATVDTQYANACYARHRVPIMPGGQTGDQTYHALSPWLMPSGLSTQHLAQLIPLDLRQQGFMTQRMGVIAFDTPDVQSVVKSILIPQIQAQGGKVIDAVYFSPTYDQLAAATANAVLKFRNDQVDRVVYMAPGGGTWLAFTRAASAQKYYPRHAISTVDEPQWTAPLIPADELVGTVGPGVLPVVDETPSQLPPPNQREKACWALLNKKTGSKYSAHDNSSTVASGECELMYLAQSGFKALSGLRWDPSRVQGGFYAIGDSYPAILFGGLGFRKGQSDSVMSYAHIVWDAPCGCMRYDSRFMRMPFR